MTSSCDLKDHFEGPGALTSHLGAWPPPPFLFGGRGVVLAGLCL